MRKIPRKSSITFQAFSGMVTIMLSVQCNGTPRSFNTEFQISSTVYCSSFSPNFRASIVPAKSVRGNFFGFILLIPFRYSCNIKLFVRISRSVAAGGISVDPSLFVTFRSSLKYVAHYFTGSS